jgi:uncharacterized protein YndB with AHSA1/START domain
MTAKTDTRYSLSVDILIDAEIEDVWDVLVNPRKAGELFWGSTVESDFKVGSPIVWKGTWDGKPFEDRGIIKEMRKGEVLQYTHWSTAAPVPTEKERNLITVRLQKRPNGVQVTFQHENIASLSMKEHSEGMWKQLLGKLKELAEGGKKA